ncbi:hypothetical protein [Variovorax sp. YR752]|uniref:hypothetical protein n=1 Tax=Variovorax sp. YR752 TaxID=1884383 RepID=UPI003137C24A
MTAGALALAAAGVWWWPAQEDDAMDPLSSAPAAATAPAGAVAAQVQGLSPLQAALRAAAAQVCADGCDEPQAAEPAAITTVAAAEPVPQPPDLDAWSLAPEPLQAVDEQMAAAGNAPRPLFNTPPMPDENDPAPADETDPYAPPAEDPAVE